MLHLVGNVVGHVVGSSAFLRREGEHAGTLEAHVLDKLAQLLEVFFGLAREADDESGAKSDVWDMLAHIFHETYGLLFVHATAHGLQDVGADVLQGQVDVMADLGILAHQVKQLVGKAERIAVMQADPLEAVDVAKGLHQLHDVGLSVEVVAVIGQVLGNEDQFLHALLGQFLGFVKQVGQRHGNVAATDERNGTEGAAAVATFGDFEVSIVLGGGQHAAAAIFRLHFLFQQVGGDEVDVLHAIEGVHLVDFRLQLLAETLREATCHIQLLDFSLLAQLGVLQDGIDRLFLCVADEAAGVDDDRVGLPPGVVADDVAVLQQGGQMLRIDLVFGATEGDDV